MRAARQANESNLMNDYTDLPTAPPNRAERTAVAVLLAAALGVWAWCGFPMHQTNPNDPSLRPTEQQAP
jgi:hypothetical protein